MNFLSLLSVISCVISTVVSYKVLVFNPAYGASHANFLGKISDILIDEGNEVTMLIPLYISSKKDQIGSKKVKNIIRIGQDPRTAAMFEEGGVDNILKSKVWKMDAQMMSLFKTVRKMNPAIGHQCEYIFQQTEILEQLKKENFDLAITESLFICPFALFDHLGIRTVINADSNLFKDAVKYAHGTPASISYYPGLFSPNNDKMSFLQRVKNLAIMNFSKFWFGSRYTAEMTSIEPYYKGGKSWDELLTSVAFLFVNSNQYIDYPSPTLPKTVFVGGMQVDTSNKKLDQEWDKILNLRKQNVLISFGSQAHSSAMPDEFKSAFLEVFASMPETTFIWKYEEANATLADHLPNVKLTTWMPQNDLLADDRLNVFVTHGGLGSTMELAYQGRPALIIPLMADQPRNAHMLARHGGALQLQKSFLNDAKKIGEAIRTVITDRKYAENARKLAKILEEQPQSPREVVLKHCNFAVAHGALDSLNSEGRHLNVIQYYSLDIALFGASLVLMAVFLVIMFIRLLCIFVLKIVSGIFSNKTKLE